MLKFTTKVGYNAYVSHVQLPHQHWYTGYVYIPQTHKLFGIKYDNPYIRELYATYSDKATDGVNWEFGVDTMSYNEKYQSLELIIELVERLAVKLKEMETYTYY